MKMKALRASFFCVLVLIPRGGDAFVPAKTSRHLNAGMGLRTKRNLSMSGEITKASRSHVLGPTALWHELTELVIV